MSKQLVCQTLVLKLLFAWPAGSPADELKPTSPIGPGYALAWHDEFDGDRLDTGKWTYRIDTRFWSVQRAENVSVADGCLCLALKKGKAGFGDPHVLLGEPASLETGAARQPRVQADHDAGPSRGVPRVGMRVHAAANRLLLRRAVGPIAGRNRHSARPAEYLADQRRGAAGRHEVRGRHETARSRRV